MAYQSEGYQPRTETPHFGGFIPKQNKTVMPFCPLLTQVVTKKDAFKLVDRYYKTMEPTEFTLLKPRQISMQLLGEVHPLKLQNPCASGLEVYLKTHTPTDQKEVAVQGRNRQALHWCQKWDP